MPFPLVDGAGSPALDEFVGGPVASSAVALGVAPHARASGWGSRAAIAIARSSGPRRVLLVDLDLASPSLHRAAGVSNDEGIIDVIEYGVSVPRVVQPAQDGSFDLIPAGEFTQDPGAILTHIGWNSVVLEAALRRATLVAVVPIDADGAQTVMERAGTVILLAEPEEVTHLHAHVPEFCSVLAVLTPPEAPTTESATPSEPQTSASSAAPPHAPRMSDETFDRIRLPKDRPSREALIRELRDRYREERIAARAEAVGQAGVPVEPAAPAESLPAAAAPESASAVPAPAPAPESVPEPESESEPEPEPESESVPLWGHDSAPSLTRSPSSRPPITRPAPLAAPRATDSTSAPQFPLMAPASRRRRTSIAAWAASILLFAGLASAAWYFVGWRFTPAEAGAAGPIVGTETADEAPDVTDSMDAAPFPRADLRFQVALPYVVAVAAYRSLPMALEREADLIEIEPELRFHIESIVRDGVLFHHVMAGPVPDSASAAGLREILIERGHKTAATPTDIRATPFAFLIGDYGSQIDAHQQLQTLRNHDIAGYIIDAAAADGRPLYRIYVGGFGSDAEAEAAAVHLRAAGLQDSVVTRTGSIINDLNSSDS